MKQDNKGFTLIEMLVVVLIIGILAGIALPQYNKAVWKTKISEAIINMKAIEDSTDRYLLANGFPSVSVYLKNVLDIDLHGGEWGGEGYYETQEGAYSGQCSSSECGFVFIDKDYLFVLEMYIRPDVKFKTCYINDNDKGRFVCNFLETAGWEYYDDWY